MVLRYNFMDAQLLVALVLSFSGFLLGAFFVYLRVNPLDDIIGLLQGLITGCMLSISFGLACNAIDSMGFLIGNFWFFVGGVIFAFIVDFLPMPTAEPTPKSTTYTKRRKRNGDKRVEGINNIDLYCDDIFKEGQQRCLHRGDITAIGVGLHRFSKGMALFLGSIQGLRVGLYPVLAMALHNIPEGVAVALPLYIGAIDKWQRIEVVIFSGLAEPTGAILAYQIFSTYANPKIVDYLLGAAGGVMAFLTLHDMLPFAFVHAGKKQVVMALFFGMTCMSLRP